MKTPEEKKAEKAAYNDAYQKTPARKAYRSRPEIKARAAETARKRQEENPGKLEARVRSRRSSLRSKLNLLKLDRGCYDCGGLFPPECLDWDHLPDTIKCFNIGSGVQDYSFESVIDEIAKCQLVCSNCHRTRTIKRRRIQKSAYAGLEEGK